MEQDRERERGYREEASADPGCALRPSPQLPHPCLEVPGAPPYKLFWTDMDNARYAIGSQLNRSVIGSKLVPRLRIVIVTQGTATF